MQGRITERIRQNARDKQGRIRKELKVYDIKFRYRDATTGKMKETCKRGFLTKGDAEAYLLRLNNQLATNTFLPENNILFRDYLTEWLETYAKINLRPTTYLGYKRIIEAHLIPYLGNRKIKDVTSIDIEHMYANLLQHGRADGKGGLSAKSVQYTHRVLNEAMTHAIKKRIIQHNPVAAVINTPKPRKFKTEVYSRQEILELLEIVKGTRFEIPVVLASVCGLRRGECLALTEDDVDFEAQTIRVNKQFVQAGRQVLLGAPKSEESDRIISAPKEVFDIIRQHMIRHEEYRKFLGSEYDDRRLLVCYEDGRPIVPVNFSNAFAALLERHGLRRIRFHDLRHSCASLMLKAGVAMKTASQILGHSSISITADLYTHVMQDLKKEAALQVGKTLFSGKSDAE